MVPSFSSVIVFAAGPVLLAAADIHPATPAPAPIVQEARTVRVTLRSTVPIHASILESTLLVLPEEEKIAEVFVGDKEFWHFETTKISTRYLSIKPLAPGVKTDLHIISDHGVSYSFLLEEVSSQAGVESDAKVFIEPGEGAIRDALTQLPAFVPADQVERYKREVAEAHAEVAEVKAAAAQDVKAVQSKAQADTDSFRAGFPAKLQFPYRWDEKTGRKLGVDQIFADDKFTYIRAHPQEAPTLYEIKDKKPSLVNFDFDKGLYTVSKRIDHGYLAVGKTKLEFWRTETHGN
jgi:type IV secretory pathway VirB9-like protein